VDPRSLLAAAISLVTTGLLSLLLRGYCHRWGWLDHPGAHKRHSRPTPFAGGWAVFAGFWAGVLFCYLVIDSFATEWGDLLPGVFLAHLVIFAGGVVDDFTRLSAWSKFSFQVAGSLVLIASGLEITVIYVPFAGAFSLGGFSYLATIIWVLAIVNAVNFVDGLNGLATGLSLATCLGLIYTGLSLQVVVIAGLAAIMVGSLLGFLRFNFPRASMFLGDSGSQTIGFVFAVMAIYCPIKSYTVVAMFVPLLSLGLPLLELLITFLRRLVSGKSIVTSDRGHLFHVLVARGLSERVTVILFCVVAMLLQVFVFALFLFDRRIVFSILVLFMVMLVVWFLRLSRREDR
jgi:UDP-GlcNAc:undecaprenyl-phosphate GlcNAc-1-phosphate transferase